MQKGRCYRKTMSGFELAVVGVVSVVEATVGVNQVYGSVSDWANSPSGSALFTEMQKLTHARAILRPSGDVENVDIEAQRNHMVEFPILSCLRTMIGRKAPAPYLLYAPDQTGRRLELALL